MSKTMPRKQKKPDTRTYSGRVAARVREVRESQNKSVQDVLELLADREVHVSEAAWYHYENGSRTLPPDLYPHVAAVLKMPLAVLLPAK